MSKKKRTREGKIKSTVKRQLTEAKPRLEAQTINKNLPEILAQEASPLPLRKELIKSISLAILMFSLELMIYLARIVK